MATIELPSLCDFSHSKWEKKKVINNTIKVKVNDVLKYDITTNESVGYRMEVELDDKENMFKLNTKQIKSEKKMSGVPIRKVHTIECKKKGEGVVKFLFDFRGDVYGETIVKVIVE